MIPLLLLALQNPIPPTPVPDTYGTHTFKINGVEETYTISGPTPIPQTPTPLVVLFHGAEGRHFEHPCTWDEYDFVERATVDYKDWFVLMHDGGRSAPCVPGWKTSANETFQLHTRRAIKQVKRYFNVDDDRIYGYGFSMGGYEALSFAARHQNPKGTMFAAVVNHSGHIMPTYAQTPPTSPYDCLYGSVYCDDPFPWQRAGIMDLKRDAGCAPFNWPPAVTDVDRWTSQIQNVGWMPIQTYHAVGEQPQTEMTAMNDLLFQVVGTWFSAPPDFVIQFDCSTWVGGCGSVYPDCCDDVGCFGSCPGNLQKHRWDAVCADATLDFLEGKTLDAYQADAFANINVTLAAENKRYHAIKVTRSSTDDFGRYGWRIEEALNKLTLFDVVAAPANVASLTVKLDEHTPLDPLDQVDFLTVNNGLGLPVPLTLDGYENGPPRFLVKDGVIKNDGNGWDWVPPDTISITDTDLAEWVVIPRP